MKFFNWKYGLGILYLTLMLTACGTGTDEKRGNYDLFARDNLLAWCIVPYDAEKRGPEERAQMLRDLGITMLAYDWRERHMPTFDAEWEALNKHGIKLQAFWMVTGLEPAGDPTVERVFDFVERNNVQTQLWTYIVETEEFRNMDPEQKVEKVVEILGYLADRAERTQCQIGLYNHRGWLGEPENQVKIIDRLDRENVGLVYNFHHAVGHHERFEEFFPTLVPHLMALNLAGIKSSDSLDFYGIGEGDAEYDMIQEVLNSSYQGPIGIINHDEQRDARVGLMQEMEGLESVLDSLRNR
ncbi:MAG TPA: TIM barrel protein [Membranihabitans sp.]|nr:TIM barrel protein [Membranihabitans sp.]